MPRLKLHFDGWLSLPARFRQQLELRSGDELEAELVGSTIVLRSVGAKGSGRPAAEEIASAAVAATPTPSILAAEPEKKEPEQPAAASPASSPAPKRRGRPAKAKG